MRRDINPLINAMLILEVDETDRLEVRVKDIGIFAESHAMGLLGPQLLATGTVDVGKEVDGYLELKPVKWLSLNGPPVIQLKVRWSRIAAEGVPTSGATAVRVDAWEALAPSAPELPESGGSGVPASSGGPAAPGLTELGGSEVPASSGRWADACARSDGSDTTHHPDESDLASPGKSLAKMGSSSSVFHFDEAVFELCKPNDALRTLLGLQTKGGSVYPFPATAGINYHALGAGFDVDAGEHVSLWGPVEVDSLPRGLDEVLEAMEAFAVKGQANPHWCSGVLVCLSWLKAMKDTPVNNMLNCHIAVVISCSSCGFLRHILGQRDHVR